MRSYPIDANRVHMISTGKLSPVVQWVGAEGSRKPDPDGRQDTDGMGRLLWRVEVIMPADEGDDRDKTGVAEVLVASMEPPHVGTFGELLRFEGLTMQPGYVNKVTKQLTAPRWSAEGIARPSAAKPAPQAA